MIPIFFVVLLHHECIRFNAHILNVKILPLIAQLSSKPATNALVSLDQISAIQQLHLDYRTAHLNLKISPPLRLSIISVFPLAVHVPVQKKLFICAPSSFYSRQKLPHLMRGLSARQKRLFRTNLRLSTVLYFPSLCYSSRVSIMLSYRKNGAIVCSKHCFVLLYLLSLWMGSCRKAGANVKVFFLLKPKPRSKKVIWRLILRFFASGSR